MADSPTDQERQQPSPAINFIYVTGAISALASTATMVATLYGVVFLIRPNLKPPEKLGATISKLMLEEGVSSDEYFMRSGRVRDDIPKESKGTLVYIQFDIQGVQKREYGTFMTLMDAKTKKAVDYQPDGKPIYWDTTRHQPAASSDKAVLLGWMVHPKRKGTYFLRVRLYDQGLAKEVPSFVRDEPNEGMLDVADSKQFTL